MSNTDSHAAHIRSIVFLLDVDNTLLDNDRLKLDIGAELVKSIGEQRTARFWDVYEEVRKVEDYVDYPTTIQRFAAQTGDETMLQAVTRIIDTIDFKPYLFPFALETIRYLGTMGTVAILSDGDAVFQPQKINGSGIGQAVGGNVLICVHKERQLPEVFARFPADHYVMVDDKPGILAALEQECPSSFTTILVLQGKYARMADYSPKPDWVVPHIGDLRSFSVEQFLEP